MAEEEKAKELTTELICGKCTEIKHCKIIGTDKCITYIRSLNAILQGYKQGQKDYVTNDRSYVIETKELSYIEIAKENGKLKRDKTELTNSVTELKTKVTELEAQLKNNPYIQILQKEKAELAEDFAKQIEKMKCLLKENSIDCEKM